MTKFITSWKFQLALNMFFFVLALVLIPVALIFDLLSSVNFVSWLSLLALVYGGLSGLTASVLYWQQKTGYTLNRADMRFIKKEVNRD